MALVPSTSKGIQGGYTPVRNSTNTRRHTISAHFSGAAQPSNGEGSTFTLNGSRSQEQETRSSQAPCGPGGVKHKRDKAVNWTEADCQVLLPLVTSLRNKETRKIDHKVLQSCWNDLIASNRVSHTPSSAAGLLDKSRGLQRRGILTQEIATQPVSVEPQLEPQVCKEDGLVRETQLEAEIARVEVTQPEILVEIAPVEGELIPNNVEAEQAETFRSKLEKAFKEARRIKKRVPLKLVR
uniref:Uncharacterized protein n=1 Tax=Romanomermis culicivorax TaxID=13658 RepID=A0A915KZF9_ROMCU